MLFLRAGILRPKGDFPECLSQAMLAGCNVSREIGRITISITSMIIPSNAIVITCLCDISSGIIIGVIVIAITAIMSSKQSDPSPNNKS